MFINSTSLLLIHLCHLHKKFANGIWIWAFDWKLNSVFNRSQKQHVSYKARLVNSLSSRWIIGLSSDKLLPNELASSRRLDGNLIMGKMFTGNNCITQHLIHLFKKQDSLVIPPLIKMLYKTKAKNHICTKQFWFLAVFIWLKCINICIQVFNIYLELEFYSSLYSFQFNLVLYFQFVSHFKLDSKQHALEKQAKKQTNPNHYFSFLLRETDIFSSSLESILPS